MRTITPNTFKNFTGKWIGEFLPEEIKVEDVQEIRVQVSALSDFVGLIAQDHTHDGSMGITLNFVSYFAICEDGSILNSPKPDYNSSSNYAHTQRVQEDGIPLGDAWGDNLSKIKYIVEYNRNLDDWEGNELTDNRFVILHLVRNNDEERIKKIRRRCEEALRKSGATTILQIAAIMEVKLSA